MTRMAMTRHVNSYDRDAPTPAIRSRWIWEPDKPWAKETITVTDVRWNGEEWWVQSCIDVWRLGYAVPGERYWNDLSRFWEAVAPLPGRM
jgi:hypothetical protein